MGVRGGGGGVVLFEVCCQEIEWNLAKLQFEGFENSRVGLRVWVG